MITRRAQAGRTVHLDFVRDAGRWKIDDIRSASYREPWSSAAFWKHAEELAAIGPAGPLPDQRG